MFNLRLIPLNKALIIGSVDVTVDVIDASVERVNFYVEGLLFESVTEAPYQWNMNLKTMGEHEIEVKVYDSAGNTASYSKLVTIYNLFGIDW